MQSILVISNLYPNKRTPYHGTFVKNFIEELRNFPGERRVEVCLLKGQPRFFLYKLYKYFVFYLFIVWKLLFHKYDLVYVHFITHASIPISFVSMFRTLNLVFNIHGEDLLVVGRLATFLLKIAKPLICKAKYIVVPSCFFKTIVLKELPNLNSEKIIVSASGGVLPMFYQKKIKNSQLDKLTIGYVSRIERGKGWDTFIKAVKILRNRGFNMSILLVGGGSQIPLLCSEINKLGLSDIRRLDRQPYKDLPKVYGQIDLFIFPTQLVESLGLVGLEAMASSTPIIGSRSGGLQDYIKDGVNGFFFNTGDENDLANKIVNYVNLSSIEKKSFMQSAYATALEYKSNIVSTRLFNLILKMS